MQDIRDLTPKGVRTHRARTIALSHPQGLTVNNTDLDLPRVGVREQSLTPEPPCYT